MTTSGPPQLTTEQFLRHVRTVVTCAEHPRFVEGGHRQEGLPAWYNETMTDQPSNLACAPLDQRESAELEAIVTAARKAQPAQGVAPSTSCQDQWLTGLSVDQVIAHLPSRGDQENG